LSASRLSSSDALWSEERRQSPLVPPYLSYKTFYGFIERLKKEVPNRIDRSVMPSLSGSIQSQLFAALRYLGLITPSKTTTKALALLVNADAAEYQKALREVLVSSYSFLFDGRDVKRMTPEEMRKRFMAAGASGDTIRKSIAFFLAAARHAQIPLSPFMTSVRTKSKPRTPETRHSSRSTLSAGAGLGNSTFSGPVIALLNKFPDFDPTWPAKIKSKWFDAFERLMARMNTEEDSG
jgi:hypothetical protein